ncbi:MAG: hypothetical protein KDC92_00520 [Bacteroidetes bacterium]|nr:hypothetical protein [Bacteroidota bacterium]
MKPFYLLFSFFFLLFACGKDESPKEPDQQPTIRPIELIAIINNDTFLADKFQVNTAISGGMYQINASSNGQRVSIIFSAKPEIKKYDIASDFALNEVSINWFEDELYSGSNHRVNNGTLEVISYNNSIIECMFNGTAPRITNSSKVAQIKNGTLKAQFPD